MRRRGRIRIIVAAVVTGALLVGCRSQAGSSLGPVTGVASPGSPELSSTGPGPTPSLAPGPRSLSAEKVGYSVSVTVTDADGTVAARFAMKKTKRRSRAETSGRRHLPG